MLNGCAFSTDWLCICDAFSAALIGFASTLFGRVFSADWPCVCDTFRASGACACCGAEVLVGAVFVCTVCSGVQLCSSCEASSRHDPSHPLIKMRVAGNSKHKSLPKQHKPDRTVPTPMLSTALPVTLPLLPPSLRLLLLLIFTVCWSLTVCLVSVCLSHSLHLTLSAFFHSLHLTLSASHTICLFHSLHLTLSASHTICLFSLSASHTLCISHYLPLSLSASHTLCISHYLPLTLLAPYFLSAAGRRYWPGAACSAETAYSSTRRHAAGAPHASS